MSVAVRDISSFENSQDLIAHYANVRRRFRGNANNRPEIKTIRIERTYDAIPVPKIEVKQPTKDAVEQLKLLQILCAKYSRKQSISIDIFGQHDLPIEGLLLIGKFINHAHVTHGIAYTCMTRLFGVHKHYAPKMRQFYNEYIARKSEYSDCSTDCVYTHVLQDILQQVSQKHVISVDELKNGDSKKLRKLARQEFCFRAVRETDEFQIDIAKFINRDMSSVRLGERVHQRRIDTMRKYRVGA
ncbi:hypothetical protein [Lentilitoribacter sp. EG35]|uniref:hypothetical protein n=1 Tax=Lentilitoribacter sp. EG35 TaxID=3234192 RepID=UPI0034617417